MQKNPLFAVFTVDISLEMEHFAKEYNLSMDISTWKDNRAIAKVEKLVVTFTLNARVEQQCRSKFSQFSCSQLQIKRILTPTMSP